jgi:arabinose-5-phosphate isomerase
MWLDPVNALHGDLGMVGKGDFALLISNSGSSAEILMTAQALKNLEIMCVALTKHVDTPLALVCDLVLPLGEHEEAGPLKLAPSASTTAMLAIGDALALTLQQLSGFTEFDYAKFHPAGALGRRLMPVSTLMRTGDGIVIANEGDSIPEVLTRITKARCGLCMIVDAEGVLQAVYSDGDFRRDWSAGQKMDNTKIKNLMHSHCKYIEEDALVGDALAVMHEYKINALPVVDSHKKVCGLIDIQDVV